MPPAPSTADESFQARILQGVSRTFALTIPTLPGGLDRAVANAYLLCRIADTIEDDAGLTLADKRAYSEQFIAIVEGRSEADSFARELAPRLAAHASAAERELISGSAAVVRITHSLNDPQRAALARCVRVMAQGMVFYQGQETLDGLSDQAAMDRYCYFVAGVVGEMLTALFCDYCRALGEREAELMQLAVSFGQGLQMTNILKDVWEDRARGACWLPRDLFAARGITLSTLAPGRGGAAFADGLAHLVAIAHGHLRNALRYTLLIPSSEPSIRRFCLWALGMAVLTLRKLHSERDFAHGAAVKISRRAVKATVATTSVAVRSDRLLQCLFGLASLGLPQQRIATPIASLAGIAGGRAAFEPHTTPY